MILRFGFSISRGGENCKSGETMGTFPKARPACYTPALAKSSGDSVKFKLPKGWEKDSDSLFLHESGVRIQHSSYHGSDIWMLVPTDLDQPVVQFEPTEEGRDKAFAAYAEGVLKPPSKRKKAAPRKKKKAVAKAKKDDGGEKEEKEAKAEKAAEEPDDGSED